MGAVCGKTKSKISNTTKDSPKEPKITKSSKEIKDSKNRVTLDDKTNQEQASMHSHRSLNASRLVQRSSVFNSRRSSQIFYTPITTSEENIHKVYKIENKII